MNLHRIFEKFIFIKKDIFTISKLTQTNYLNSFNDTNSLTKLSFYQYKCQIFFRRKVVLYLFNFISIFLLLLILFPNKKPKQKVNESKLYIGTLSINYLFPQSLNNSKILKVPFKQGHYANFKDKIWFLKMHFRYLNHPYFVFKNYLNFLSYGFYIFKYNPRVIYTHNEVSFSSSFLTYYCRLKKIRHENIMHGEKLFNIRDAFCTFDKFYVWDKHYINLFKSLRAIHSNYIIFKKPINYKVTNNFINSDKITYFLSSKYYLNDYFKIRQSLIQIKNIDNSVIKVRFHPRTDQVNMISKVFPTNELEDPNITNYFESILSSKYVISLFSTALYDASLLNVPVVIDDITDITKFYKLKELDFIIFKKPHILLSQLLSSK